MASTHRNSREMSGGEFTGHEWEEVMTRKTRPQSEERSPFLTLQFCAPLLPIHGQLVVRKTPYVPRA